MSVRRFTTQSLVLAAVAAVALPLSAQDTRVRRPADTRISTSKGDVALPPRVDTVFVDKFRYDTVRVTNTVLRVDTVIMTVTPPPPPPRIISDWFWSVYSGATAPVSEISRLYSAGYHFGAAGGWDPRDSWFGARASLSYSQLGHDAGFPAFLDEADPSDNELNDGNPATWQFALDLKAKWPSGGWAPYLIGGLGFNTYNNVAAVADGGDLVFNPGEAFVRNNDTFCRRDFDDGTEEVGDGDNVDCFRVPGDATKFSWNFGLGSDFRIGSQDVFFEWRWNPIRTHDAWTWTMPVSLGVRFF